MVFRTFGKRVSIEKKTVIFKGLGFRIPKKRGDYCSTLLLSRIQLTAGSAIGGENHWIHDSSLGRFWQTFLGIQIRFGVFEQVFLDTRIEAESALELTISPDFGEIRVKTPLDIGLLKTEPLSQEIPIGDQISLGVQRSVIVILGQIGADRLNSLKKNVFRHALVSSGPAAWLQSLHRLKTANVLIHLIELEYCRLIVKVFPDSLVPNGLDRRFCMVAPRNPPLSNDKAHFPGDNSHPSA